MNVFICADTGFPHKGAASNYIETLARALVIKKINVYVTAISYNSGEIEDWIEYSGFYYKTIPYDVSNKKKTLFARLNIGKEIWNCISQKGISSDDVIICYTENFFFLRHIYSKAKRRNIKVINCVVEWYEARQFKYGYLDIFNFWYYCMGFYRGMGISKNVIVISKKLEEYFKNKGCNTFIIPPLIVVPKISLDHKTRDKMKFIYSGAFKNKDSMQVMLEAFVALPDEIKNQVEFHVTGYGYEQLYKESSVTSKIWEDVKELLVLHSWMEYSELLELYQQMDYLLIARESNRATLSNFPSKVPEMMAYGIIPVMTQVGDLPNLYLENGRDSILFDQCTVESCRDAIVQAVQMNKSERILMRENTCKKAMESFAYEKWADVIYNFIM